MGSLFFMEHALIAVGLVIELGIVNTPIDAKNAFRRRVYQRLKTGGMHEIVNVW